MGRFDGVLICSDVDGTFAVGREIPPRNLDAIRAFVSEGGRFTLSSGRVASYLRRMPGVIYNAPLIVCNGTRIVDDKTDETLWSRPMTGEDRFGPSTALATFPHKAKLLLLYHMEEDRSTYYTDPAAFSPEAKAGMTLLKVVTCFDCAADTDEWIAYARAHFPGYQFVHSWSEGAEQLALDAGKDRCVRWLRDYLSVRTLVCVGDQENDLSMLKEADVACCPANATEEVKAACDHVLCGVEEGTIAEVIDILSRTLS